MTRNQDRDARASARRISKNTTCCRKLDTEPAAPHLTVDNRLTAAVPLAGQVAALVQAV